MIGPVQSIPTLPGLPGLEQVASAKSPSSAGFGELVGEHLSQLQALEQDAASQAQAVATGASADLAGALLSVERADLALQLTTQLRNKAVEAYQEVMRMQV